MSKSKILVGIIILLCMLFAIFQFQDYEWLSEVSRSLVVPSVAFLYLTKHESKLCCFGLFLILFSLSELITIVELLPIVKENVPYSVIYYLGNGLYIMAYGFLIYEIVKSLNIIRVVKNFPLHLIVLGALNVYLIFVLKNIIDPYLISSGEYIIEMLYNIAILLLLSTSLINFLYKGTKKALIMFIASLCLAFSEVIQIAYMYIADKVLLNISYSILLVLAFYLFYVQATLSDDDTPILARHETY